MANWKNYKLPHWNGVLHPVKWTQWSKQRHAFVECESTRDGKILREGRKKSAFSYRDTEFKTNSYRSKSMYNGREIKTDSSPACRTLVASATLPFTLGKEIIFILEVMFIWSVRWGENQDIFRHAGTQDPYIFCTPFFQIWFHFHSRYFPFNPFIDVVSSFWNRLSFHCPIPNLFKASHCT